MVVVNDLTDDTGGPRIIAKPDDALPLFPMAAKNEDAMREIARGYMFVMRALHSHDHDPKLIPDMRAEAWKEPKKYTVAQTACGWKMSGLDILWERAFYTFELDFDKQRRPKGAKAIDTGST